MSKIALKRITLNNFGPFVGKHEVDLPETGLVLIKATVKETGDGSGAGKSFFLKAISRLTGGCQDPNTSLQSWYTDEPPESSIVLQKEGQDITLAYKKGR